MVPVTQVTPSGARGGAAPRPIDSQRAASCPARRRRRLVAGAVLVLVLAGVIPALTSCRSTGSTGGEEASGASDGATTSRGRFPAMPAEIETARAAGGEADGRPPSPEPSATNTPSSTPEPSRTATPRPTLSPTAVPTQTPVPSYRTWGTQFGYEFDATRHRENVALELRRAADAGLESIRTNVLWSEIEPQNVSPSEFSWAATDARLQAYSAAGFDLVLTVVSYPAWATVYGCGYELRPGMETEWREFTAELARRYAPPEYAIAAFEIGNEIDGTTRVDPDDHDRPPGWGAGEPTLPVGGCWGDRPDQYTAFLRSAHDAIKAVRPSARVMHGSLAFTGVEGAFHRDFLERFLASGGGGVTDVVGYHWFPDLKRFFPDEPTGLQKYSEIAATMAGHGVARPIWLTETYKLTEEGDPSGEIAQVEFLTKELVELVAVSDLQRVYWYSFVDYPNQEPGYRQRGLVRADRSPKLALGVLPFVIRHTNGSPEMLSSNGLAAFGFRGTAGELEHVVVWSRTSEPTELAVPAGGSAAATALTVSSDELGAGRCCREQNLISELDRFALSVGPDATFLSFE